MSYGEIFILGEAWGEHEERARAPFVGPSGYELTRMLDEAGIARRDCYLSNVFNLRPKENNIENLCGTPSVNGYGPISKGKSIKADYAPELDRVLRELRSVKPNLVLALGNTAAWFLLNATGISKFRGTIQEAPFSSQGLESDKKSSPPSIPQQSYDSGNSDQPSSLISSKPDVSHAFQKLDDLREVWIAESLQDIALFYRTYLEGAKEIAFDIETAFNEITCIGFAPSEKIALCIPFVDYRKNGWSYWSAADEVQAWQWVKNILHLPAAKTAHNGIFDIHFLWRKLGATPTNYTTDTMLLHHALQPESRKGLGFLGSVYTNEASWKLMRQSDKILEKREK